MATGVSKGKKRKMATTIINDPIHGNIELHPLLVKIIDTPEFQRLRFIKQLGGGYFVYPGASHNRFEHSIGVCHLAGRLVRALKDKNSKALEGVEITPIDEICVEIAALCHDLGHGPFSHLFDSQIIPATVKKDKKWKHEKGSIDMLDHMLEENKELKAAFSDEGITYKDVTFIKEMIYGPLDKSKEDSSDWRYEGRTDDKSFLYEIVSNKRNGIDVDKWDYFARDSYMLGIGNNFNLERCIAFSRVIEVISFRDGREIKEKQICFRDKEAGNLYDMFHTRLLLHQRAYQHKTVNIIEHMITEALLQVEMFITFRGKDGNVCLSETIDDMKAYTLLTDNVFHRVLEMDDVDPILETDDEDTKKEKEEKSNRIQKSKGILKRVLFRNSYKCISEKKFPGGSFTNKESVKGEIKAMMTGKAEFDKMDKNGVIDIVNFNYGKKHENPLDYVNFYSKIDYDKAGPREKEDVSLLLPKVFEEQLVRFYWKEELEDYTEVKRGFEKWAKSAYTEKQKKCKTCKQHIIDPNRTEQDKGLKELTRSTTGTSSTTGTTTTTTTTKEKGLH